MVCFFMVEQGAGIEAAKRKAKCIPSDFAQSSFSKYNNHHQEGMSVLDYTEEFYKLVARNDIQETEEQLTTHCTIHWRVKNSNSR